MKKSQLFTAFSAALICSAAPYQRMTFRDSQGKISGSAVKFGEQVIYRDADGKPAATVSGDGEKIVIKDAGGAVTGIKPQPPENNKNDRKK